jgi:hypothetical protein
MTTNGSNIRPLIDEYGLLKMQAKILEDKIEQLKGQLVELGEGAHDGDKYRLTVTLGERKQVDMDAVRAKVTPQWLAKHTDVTPTRTLRTSRLAD